MRCEASELGAPGLARAAISASDGGAVGAAAPPVIETPSAIAQATALPKRRTRCLVEEVEVPGVDPDRDVRAELELDVRREGRDQVRTGADHRFLRLRLECLLLLARLALEAPSVDLEVGHGLPAQRLDELDARSDGRQLVLAL